jgi:hypothetical protein
MAQNSVDWNQINRVLKMRKYRGIGDVFRRCSQYFLLKDWEQKYDFGSAVESPYDEATDGVDGLILSCPYKAVQDIDKLQPKSFDLVWNFGFIQRQPLLILKMRRISKKYIAAFTPNCFNPGLLVHKFYHFAYEKECTHPERGDASFMKINGLIKLFEWADLKVLEYGYIDIPPWPDTVVTIKQFFGKKSWEPIEFKVNIRPLLIFEKVLLPKAIFAHHCYILGQLME